MAPCRSRRALWYDGLILALLIVPQILVAVEPAFRDEPRHWVVDGFYAVLAGTVFLLGYFFPGGCYSFRALHWFCTHISAPRGRGMAIVWALLFLGLGIAMLLQGFGILDLTGDTGTPNWDFEGSDSWVPEYMREP